MGMGFAPTWLRQVSPLHPLLHMTSLTTGKSVYRRTKPLLSVMLSYRLSYKDLEPELELEPLQRSDIQMQQHLFQTWSSFHQHIVDKLIEQWHIQIPRFWVLSVHFEHWL